MGLVQDSPVSTNVISNVSKVYESMLFCYSLSRFFFKSKIHILTISGPMSLKPRTGSSHLMPISLIRISLMQISLMRFFKNTARPRDTRILVPEKNRAAQIRASWGLYLCTKWDFFFKKQCIFKAFLKNPRFVRLHLCTKGVLLPIF